MIFRIKLNLLEIKNHTFTENIDLAFDNTQNFEYCAESDVEHITKLHLYCTPNSVLLDVYLDYEEEPDYNFDGSDIEQFSTNNEFVIFDATIDDSDIATLYQFYEMGLIEFVLDAQTLLFVYKQNSDNEHLNKSLTFVNILQGEFNHSIGVKNINVDIHNFELNFNYVFMPNLNRYYYVDSVEIVSADISRLHLKEDVLMTWKSLIYRQKGLISRWEDSSAKTLVDNRLPVEDIVTTEYIDLNPYRKQTGNQTNCRIEVNKLSYDFTCLMLVTYAKDELSTHTYAPAPWITSDLPNIPALISNRIHVDFMKLDDYSSLYRACQLDDATTSYILNLMYIPIRFFETNPYHPLAPMTRSRVVVNNKKLNELDGFVNDNGQLETSDVECERANVPAPYLIIAHFNYNPDNVDFTFYEPYSKYEIFIPFVGWVDINANKLLNKELMIYYSLDVTTGQGSAYIYSVTDSAMVWAGNCTIGIKLPLSTTNNLENLKQKQSNDLNMIIGLISSALSIGVGVVTENPVAIAGGVLSAGKSIASNVQANKMLIEKMNTSFGSNESAFYSPEKIWVRKSYHKKLTNDLTTYKKTQGYPLNRYDDLQEYSGYVEIGDLHFDPMNENIYQDEISEIINLLHNGVVF